MGTTIVPTTFYIIKSLDKGCPFFYEQKGLGFDEAVALIDEYDELEGVQVFRLDTQAGTCTDCADFVYERIGAISFNTRRQPHYEVRAQLDKRDIEYFREVNRSDNYYDAITSGPVLDYAATMQRNYGTLSIAQQL